jgi:hypothetical protein
MSEIAPSPVGSDLREPTAPERLNPPSPLGERVDHNLRAGLVIGNRSFDVSEVGWSANRYVLGYLCELNGGITGMRGVAPKQKNKRGAKNDGQRSSENRRVEPRNPDMPLCGTRCRIAVQVSYLRPTVLNSKQVCHVRNVLETAQKECCVVENTRRSSPETENESNTRTWLYFHLGSRIVESRRRARSLTEKGDAG